MTNIFCSNKLKEFLGKNYFNQNNALINIYGDWNAHLFYIYGRKNIILVNNKSYYAVILPNIKKADFSNFSTLFFNRLIEQLIFDKAIEPSEVLLTIQKYTPLIFEKTNNDKKTIGTINEFIFQLEHCIEDSEWHNKKLLEINNYINNCLTGAARTKKFDYGRPIEDMMALLKTCL